MRLFTSAIELKNKNRKALTPRQDLQQLLVIIDAVFTAKIKRLVQTLEFTDWPVFATLTQKKGECYE